MQELVTKISYILFGVNPFFTSLIFFGLFTIVYSIHIKLRNSQFFLFLFSIVPLLFWLVRLLLNDYFLSDDFDHFILVTKYSFGEIFIKGMLADNLWAFHRLFTGFVVFKLIYILFGTSYEAYVVFNFIIHVLNIYLLSLLLRKYLKNNYIICLILFITSFFYLTWISNIHELLAGFFMLLTLNLLFRNKSTLLILITYSLGVFSKEIVFLLPICFFLIKPSFATVKKHKSLYFLFLIYTGIFVIDYLKLSNLPKMSGYDTTLNFNLIANHFTFYLNERINFWPLLIILKAPFILSYTVLILPVLFLSKATIYYSYIPFFFIALGMGDLFNRLKKIKILYINIIFSLLIVFIFNGAVIFQENLFLIQFPRTHPRKQAMIDLLKGNSNTSDEARWLLENDYVKYFKK